MRCELTELQHGRKPSAATRSQAKSCDTPVRIQQRCALCTSSSKAEDALRANELKHGRKPSAATRSQAERCDTHVRIHKQMCTLTSCVKAEEAV